jgi:predicted N-formylglutamate amidohydrolase
LTCEHATNRVPAGVRAALGLSAARLVGHRAYDLGAAPMARALANELGQPLLLGGICRLVVDLNRSPNNPRVWSDWSRRLPPRTREALLRQHHWPHWNAVETSIGQLLASHGRVVHVGVHSFTPVLDGVRRTMDVGLLYDPARRWERALAGAWKHALGGELKVRRNAPYRGVDDGLTRQMRRRFPDTVYAGVELELNQGALVDGRFPRRLRRLVTDSLRTTLATLGL